jgi:hypothetical protein
MQCARRCGVALVLAVCLLGAGAAAVGAASAGGGRPLAEIVEDLGAAEFAVRERAQGELAKVPWEQLEALKEAQKQATDAEVKARLEARIAELIVEPLLHPPKLSVDLKDATLVELAAALNKQMGAAYIEGTATARGGVLPRVTLVAKEQPLWKILRQVNETLPMAFSRSTVQTPSGSINTIRLIPEPAAAPPLPAAASRPRLFTTEGVGTVPQTAGDPATGNWEVRCTIYTDPRVRLARYATTLRVERALDQDGRALVAVPPTQSGMAAPVPPLSSLNCTATLAAAPQVKAIKELRGSVAVEVVESEELVGILIFHERSGR